MNDLDEIMSDTDSEERAPRTTQPLDGLPPLKAGYVRLIDVKDVPIEDVEEALQPEVEERAAEPEPIIIDAQHQEPPKKPWRKILVFGAPCVVIVAALALASILIIAPLLVPTANVTLIPIAQTVTTQLDISVMTQNADISKNQIPARSLSSGVISQQKTIDATGRGHQDATAARGTVTFYNAAATAQTIPAGTLITSASGVDIATDQDVYVPGAVLPSFGQASGSAHAVNAGPSGDIAPGDISGHCCRADIQATNTAFSGGQSASDYTMVAQQDIDSASQSVKTALEQSARATIQAQVKNGETALSAVCNAAIESDHKAEDEAAQVNVTVDETCTAVAYATQTVYDLGKQSVATKAGAGLLLSGAIQETVKQTSGATLQVQASGLYFVDVTQGELHKLSQQIAGKSRDVATKILLNAPGIQQVQGLPDELPQDPARVRLMVLYSA